MANYDIQKLKATLDCREVVAREWGPPKYGGKGTHQWRCLFHNEQKGFAFCATAQGWKCFGKCQDQGDAISFIMKMYDIDFKTACVYLGLSETGKYSNRGGWDLSQPPVFKTTLAQANPPTSEWQAIAQTVVEKAQDILWSGPNPALDYLRSRGLKDKTIQIGGLGYVPDDLTDWYKNKNGFYVPTGITLPAFTEGQLWQVRVRRLPSWLEQQHAAGKEASKYTSISGGKLIGSLFMGDQLLPDVLILIDEGEINSLTVYQMAEEMGVNVSVAALTSASNNLTSNWWNRLLLTPLVLFRMDTDPAGAACLARHMALCGSLKPAPYPFKDDINSVYLQDKPAAYQWLSSLLT